MRFLKGKIGERIEQRPPDLKEDVMREVFKATPHLLKFPVGRMWIDYDKEADVLYISFKRPQKATDSEMLENGILVRYRGDEIVGLTVLEASKRNGRYKKRKAPH